MLLESRINERTTLTIDAEIVVGIDKGANSAHAHPDKMVPAIVAAIRAVAENLGQAVDGVERIARGGVEQLAVRVVEGKPVYASARAFRTRGSWRAARVSRASAWRRSRSASAAVAAAISSGVGR